MKIPLSYNLRNLRTRKVTTLMTVLGTGLAVAVLVSVLALVEGLRTSFDGTGHPEQILVTRKGASAELTSVVNRDDFNVIRSMKGIALGPSGELLASLEMVTVIDIENATSSMNVNLRALLPVGVEMRPQISLKAGRFFSAGRREVVIGRGLADRYPELRIGRKIRFGRGEWEIVGIMDGGRSAYNSEVFADLNQVSADYGRTGFLSSALLRAEPGHVQKLIDALLAERRLNVLGEKERDYYARQTNAAIPVEFMGLLVAAIMAVGSAFAAMNTMYAAVARRSPEIGTLRVLGFSRVAILFSFLIESLILSLAGGVFGCLLALPLNRVRTGMGSFTTFSEMTFNLQVSPRIVVAGVLFSLVIGAVGGFMPARSAANKQILAALRG